MTDNASKSNSRSQGFFKRLFSGYRQSAIAEAQHAASPHVRPSDVASPDAKFVQIPLRSVIAALPLELQGKVKKTAIGDVNIPISQAKILAQLTTGAVCVSFGEVRSAAPAIFLGGADADKVMVSLPLGEILPRLNPALLARRAAQRHVEVSRNITSPFDDPAQALIFSVGGEQAAARAASAPVSAPAGEVVFKPISRKPALPPAAPMPTPRPATLAIPQSQSPAGRPLVVRMTHPPRKQAVTVNNLTLPLASLAENWPDVVREEIIQRGLAETKIALPAELMEVALKRARVVFHWKVVRSWIRPALQPYNSNHDSVEVELPLRVVAPMFMQKRNNGDRVQQRFDIDESIPNLFFGFPKAETPAVTPANDTNYYVWSDTSDSVQSGPAEEPTFKKKSPTGTEFIAKYATPNEIVSRAAALDGVAGAVIALPDGLMVASQIPPEHNGETLAAFLPLIFARVAQSTRELHMGDLNNLSFTVGNVPWKIFRVNAIFFAAFGREGEGMPSTKLAGLAAELDRKQK